MAGKLIRQGIQVLPKDSAALELTTQIYMFLTLLQLEQLDSRLKKGAGDDA